MDTTSSCSVAILVACGLLQVCAEFQQIAEPSKHILHQARSPYSSIDDLFSDRRLPNLEKTADTLADIFKCTMDRNYMISAQGVPLFPLLFLCICMNYVAEPEFGDGSVGCPKTVSGNGMSLVHYHPVQISVVLEGGLVFAKPMRERNYVTMLDPIQDMT